MPLPAGRGELP